MRLFIASMPFLALTTMFVTTAQRVPPQKQALRDSILPQTLDILRHTKAFRNSHTILDDINQSEGHTTSLATARPHVLNTSWWIANGEY